MLIMREKYKRALCVTVLLTFLLFTRGMCIIIKLYRYQYKRFIIKPNLIFYERITG